MRRYIDETYEGRVEIDGARFEGCTFNNAVLAYSGGGKPSFKNCKLTRSIFVFEGPAGNMLTLLQDFAQPSSGFQNTVRKLLPGLEAGAPTKGETLKRSVRSHAETRRATT